MSAQKVSERSDNKVVALAIKTHAPIRGEGTASCGERALNAKLDAHKSGLI